MINMVGDYYLMILVTAWLLDKITGRGYRASVKSQSLEIRLEPADRGTTLRGRNRE